MTICNFFSKVRTRYFGVKEEQKFNNNNENNNVQTLCYKKQEIQNDDEHSSSELFTNESLEFEIIDFKHENSIDSCIQSSFNHRKCYSIDAQQRRQQRFVRKPNTNLSLSFSGPRSTFNNHSRDRIYAELAQNGTPFFVNSWSHLNEKRSKQNKLSDYINSKKIIDCSSSFYIDNQQYTNLTAQDFRRIKDLGSGNFGYVQQFLHLQSGIHIAVKRMKYVEIESNENDNRKHVLNELELLSKSKHENIVKFFGYIIFHHDSELWLCMELMDCCFDRLIYNGHNNNNNGNNSRMIPESIIGSVTVSIIDALIYLKQTHKMIHRDIKPSNILINHRGQIKLCDFGISGCLIDSITSSRTIGSHSYQAPELFQHDFEIDFKYDCRVDVWSLGITLLEMALGHHPYGQWTVVFEIITKILNPKNVPTLSTTTTTDGKYSKNFKNFIDTCLQYDYRLRPKYDQIKMTKFLKEQIKKFNLKIVSEWFYSVYFNNNDGDNNFD